MRQLKSYLPPNIYNNIKETNELFKAEQPHFNNLNNEFKLAFNRQFIINADSVGISQYEKILEIYPKSTDLIDFRKKRVILKLNSSPPFTIKYLRNCMDKIVGANNYRVWVDYNNFMLHIEGTAKNEDWFIEITKLLARIKPANILYSYTTHPHDILRYYIGIVECQIGRKKINITVPPKFIVTPKIGIVSLQVGKKKINIATPPTTKANIYTGIITRKTGKIQIGGIK